MLSKFFVMSAMTVAVCATCFGAPIPDEYKQNGFAVGCQTYSFNRYSLLEAIEKTAEAGGKIIEFYPGQKLSKMEPETAWNHDASSESITMVKEKLKQHGIKAVNYGVVTGKDAAEWRKIFEFAKVFDLYAITTEDILKLDIIEPLVKEFDIRLAIHNHPRKIDDPDYKVWDPHYVMAMTKDRDPRIGACADTGHWMTSGINPLYALRALKGRVISSHMKDKGQYGPNSHNVVYGTGKAEIGLCLDELRKQDFEGNISVEHEYNWTTSVPDIKLCIDFVRNHQIKTEAEDAATTESE